MSRQRPREVPFSLLLSFGQAKESRFDNTRITNYFNRSDEPDNRQSTTRRTTHVTCDRRIANRQPPPSQRQRPTIDSRHHDARHLRPTNRKSSIVNHHRRSDNARQSTVDNRHHRHLRPTNRKSSIVNHHRCSDEPRQSTPRHHVTGHLRPTNRKSSLPPPSQ